MQLFTCGLAETQTKNILCFCMRTHPHRLSPPHVTKCCFVADVTYEDQSINNNNQLTIYCDWWGSGGAAGGATDTVTSAHQPSEQQWGQHTNQRACCSRGGGVTQVRVAALGGEFGNLGEQSSQLPETTVRVLDTLAVRHPTCLSECQTGIFTGAVALFVAAGIVIHAAEAFDGCTQPEQSAAHQQTEGQGTLHLHFCTLNTHRSTFANNLVARLSGYFRFRLWLHYGYVCRPVHCRLANNVLVHFRHQLEGG